MTRNNFIYMAFNDKIRRENKKSFYFSKQKQTSVNSTLTMTKL